MHTSQPVQTPQQIFAVANIIWLAFLGSLVAFAAVAYFMHQSSGLVVEPPLGESLSHPIVIAMAVMGFFNLGLAHMLPRLMPLPPQSELRAPKSFQLCILQFVLVETLGVFGLGAAFITHQSQISYLFSAIAFAITLKAKPNRENFGLD